MKWTKQGDGFYKCYGEKYMYAFNKRFLIVRSGLGYMIGWTCVVKDLKTAKKIAELLEL